MADKLPWLATESGNTYVTGGSPDPKVNLSGTATSLSGYPTRTFAEAATDSNTDFADGDTCVVLIVDEADVDTWELWENAVWNDDTTDYVDLSSATKIGQGPSGALSNSDTVTVYAEPSFGIGDLVDDLTPQLGGDLDVNGQKLVTVSNGDIVLEPDGTGSVVVGDTGGSSFESPVSDGATAVAYDFDTANSLITSGSKLFDLKNSGEELLAVSSSGHTDITGSLSVNNTDAVAALSVRRLVENTDSVFSVDSATFSAGGGNLTHIDSDDQGDAARGVWGDGNFIYLANYGGGLHTYSVDGSGNLTHIDSDDQGDTAYDVWGDGDFIYLANGNGGLHSYSVDGSGILTHIDSDDQGGAAHGVWGDGNFIYLANYTGGLHTYSVDGSGNLTHLDSDDQGDNAVGVWGDGNFIYLVNQAGGLHTYSVDGSGNLTHIDSDDQGDEAKGVWGDGNFIYLANGDGGLHTYSVDGSGILTHLDSDDQGDLARGVWGDSNFIYLANRDGGLHTYSVNGSGILTHMDSDDQGDLAFGVWGDGNFIYLANHYGGLHTYSVAAPGTITGYTDYLTVSSDGNVGIGTTTPDSELDINGAVTQRELSADPADPAEGTTVKWMSDGTGSGDDGDIMMKITAGGTTKTVTLIDFSAA